MIKGWSAAIRRAAWVLAVTLCACAQPAAENGGTAITHDPDHLISGDHWEVIDLPKESVKSAAVVDSTHAVAMILSCDLGDKTMFLGMSVQPDRARGLTEPSLDLGLDGAAPAPAPWNAEDSRTEWSFYLAEPQPEFWNAIADLKRHHALTALVRESGKESMRFRFVLTGAPQAIDYVLNLCGRPAKA